MSARTAPPPSAALLTEVQRERVGLLVAKLRSGAFRRGTGRLRRKDRGPDRFCCLGVACEVFREETGEGEWLDNGGGDRTSILFHVNGREEWGVLTGAVAAWFGFPLQNPEVGMARGPAKPLAHLNDGGYSHKRIADLIERTYLAPAVRT